MKYFFHIPFGCLTKHINAVYFLDFLKILGRNDILPCAVCETFGAVTHFAWMATFAWIGNDSNFLNLFNLKL